METKANYLMIGGFVLGVLALAFIFVFWMTNLAGGGKRYFIVFDGSVAGLTTGSSVGFNGIKVGEVQSMQLDPADARKVQVLISVHAETPVRENSHASMQSLGLTGGTGIQISAGTPDSPFLVATAETPIPVIAADRGGGQGLFDAAPAVMNNANALLLRLNDLVAENQEFDPQNTDQCGKRHHHAGSAQGRHLEDHYQCSGGGPVLQGLIWKA